MIVDEFNTYVKYLMELFLIDKSSVPDAFLNIHLSVETMSFRESLNTIQIREVFSRFHSGISQGLLRHLNGFTHGQNWNRFRLLP